MSSPDAAGPAAIARTVMLQPGSWTVVVFRDTDVGNGIAQLLSELQMLSEEEEESARSIKVVVASRTAVTLVEDVTACTAQDVIIVRGIEDLPIAEIEALDVIRNRALESATTIIATTPNGAAILNSHSPNLWSWIGSQVVEYDPSEGVMDPEARLQSLRDHFQKTDHDVIAAAENGALPSDPAYVEWLILLNRADLIAS